MKKGKGDGDGVQNREMRAVAVKNISERKREERTRRWKTRWIITRKSDFDKEWRGKMETSFVLPLSFFSLFLSLFFSFSGFLPQPLAEILPHFWAPCFAIG
jgi:hypothetical protein